MKNGDCDPSDHWIVKPKSKNHLCEMLAKADGSRSISGFDLSQISGMVRHTPEDLTATILAGTRLRTLQKQLSKHRQWLPIDPPRDRIMSIGALIAGNWSGPRRFGFGCIRDYLIGLKVILADGSESNSGGQVVKNVAGFDLPKLFVGSRGSLGVIIEATFKLAPLPENESILRADANDGNAISDLAQNILSKSWMPSILDAHNLDANGNPKKPEIMIGFSGSKEDVAFQVSQIEKIVKTQSATFGYENRFWNHHSPAFYKSVLPTEIGTVLNEFADQPWLARVGNGIFYTPKRLSKNVARVPSKLEMQLKKSFDPKGILPAIP